MTEGTTSRPGVVTLAVPAQSVYAAVLRTTAAAIAARLDFTLDDVEDLRIAVGEASALLLDVASPDDQLDAKFTVSPELVDVTLSVPSTSGAATDTDSFAWQVLSTLTSRCGLSSDQGRSTITLSIRSTLTD